MKYKVEIAMLEENMEKLSGELYSFFYKKRKRSGIDARHILQNIKKICQVLRSQINTDIKAMPKEKRFFDPIKLEQAKEKRKKTMEKKKAGKL